MTKCSNCKKKTETHKVYTFRLCKHCWQQALDLVKKLYPVWR